MRLSCELTNSSITSFSYKQTDFLFIEDVFEIYLVNLIFYNNYITYVNNLASLSFSDRI